MFWGKLVNSHFQVKTSFKSKMSLVKSSRLCSFATTTVEAPAGRNHPSTRSENRRRL